MAKKKQPSQAPVSAPEEIESDILEAQLESMFEEEPVVPAPLVQKAPPAQILSIEQVALSLGGRLNPAYKAHHLPSIQKFCATQGHPQSGTETQMIQVLLKYGYKI